MSQVRRRRDRRGGLTVFLRDDEESLPVRGSKELRESGAEFALRLDRAVARSLRRDLAHKSDVGLFRQSKVISKMPAYNLSRIRGPHLFKHAAVRQEPQEVPIRQPPRNLLHPFVRHEHVNLLLPIRRIAMHAHIPRKELSRDVLGDRREARRDRSEGLVLESGAVLVRERHRTREERVRSQRETVRDLKPTERESVSRNPGMVVIRPHSH